VCDVGVEEERATPHAVERHLQRYR
jgi:hypothetical protein